MKIFYRKHPLFKKAITWKLDIRVYYNREPY